MQRLIGIAAAVVAALAARSAHGAPEYPLEVRFQEWHADGKHALYGMPVTITDDNGRVVLETKALGPSFSARLPKGRYTVSTRWDGWTFSRDVVVDGKGGESILFAWAKPDARASSTG